MVTYKSARQRTVVVANMPITQERGITLDTRDAILDQLVKEGFLVVDADYSDEVPLQ